MTANASNRALLMSTLKQVLNAFEVEKLPLTGVMRTALSFPTLRTAQHITTVVASSSTQEGLSVIQQLNKQRDFLLQTGPLDEENSARTALSGWHLIQQKHGGGFSARTAALAVEDAALHVHSIAAPPRSTWWMEDDDPSQPLERAIACGAHLDLIAEGVQRRHPGVFPAPPDASGAAPTLELARPAQLMALAECLSGPMRFRHEPYEWVYDGFKPLLLPDVVIARKGMSVSLVTLLVCVMRRLGVTAVPCFSYYQGEANARADELAQLHVGRQLATTPTPVDIVLCGGEPHQPVFLDPCARSGEWVTDATTVSPRYASFVPSHQWTANEVFRLWAEHARTMMIACQRRGQSDAVSDWMYQHAALDPVNADFPGVDTT